MKHDTTEDSTDWLALFRAFSDAFEWALDLAGGLAGAYPAEVACVERVRAFARKRLAGDPAHLRIDDLLFAFGLLAGALEKDVRPALTPRALAAAPAVAERTVTTPERTSVKRTPRVSHRKPALRRTTFSVRAVSAARPRSALEIARERWAA